MNHKRRRPKHQRAGCIFCKPHKDERRAASAPVSAERRMQDPAEDRRTEDTWHDAEMQAYADERTLDAQIATGDYP